jgi:hypothetical protein
MTLVTFDVCSDLRNPIRAICAFVKFLPSLTPIPAMPEVTVTENHNAISPKHDIWFAR